MKTALREALDSRGYETLTPVQQAVLEQDKVGHDLLVSAQTGSGKTLAFGLAIAPTILAEHEQFETAEAPLALIIAPTRELALQVKRELGWLFAKAGANLASCVGGMDMRDERRALARGAHIVVATPGRLRDHIMRGSIDLGSIRSIVLDEADEMLDLGFREDLEFILGESPQDRQTLLFSATVPKSILGLAERYQKDAIRIVTKSETTQHADISYFAYGVAERDAENAVINTLLYHQAPNAIVFGNTRAMVNRLTARLSNRGFRVVALSGELSQAERTHALQAMRDGRAQVCVATDVAARGIDLPKLDLVVHAELPNNNETLLHRSGRTGRAGRKGVSALIVTKKTQKKAERILRFAKVTAEWTSAPSAQEVHEREEERMLADPAWEVPVEESEQDSIAHLQERFSPEQLAAGYLRLYRSVRSSPEEIGEIETKPAPRAEFGPSVWFAISGGRDAGAEPRRLLPMLCKAGNLTKDNIGAIRVRQDQSFVQIAEDSVATFLNAVGPDMVIEEGAIATQLAEPPVLDNGPRKGPRPGGPRKSFDGPREDRPRGPREDRPRGPREDRPRAPREDRPRRKDADKSKSDWHPIEKPDAPERPKRKPRDQDWNKPQEWVKPSRPRGEGPRRERAPAAGEARPKRDPEVHGGFKPKSKPRAADPSKPKGPPPPKGKPNSKKNKARAAAAKVAKGKGGGKAPAGKPRAGKPAKKF